MSTKVDNQFYELFSRLNGSVCKNLRKAAIQYYNFKVDRGLPNVNEKKPLRQYDDIVKRVDALISRYFNDEGF